MTDPKRKVAAKLTDGQLQALLSEVSHMNPEARERLCVEGYRDMKAALTKVVELRDGHAVDTGSVFSLGLVERIDGALEGWRP